jgi:uncharacterized protein with GYD domain
MQVRAADTVYQNQEVKRSYLMPKFLVEATYTAEGHKGLAKDKASGRRTAVTQTIKKLGGKLDAIYFCLGENDLILIVDMPDHVSAAALSSAACASGMARTKTTVLLTVEEADEALSKPVSTGLREPNPARDARSPCCGRLIANPESEIEAGSGMLSLAAVERQLANQMDE